jgi:hypothetical protein
LYGEVVLFQHVRFEIQGYHQQSQALGVDFQQVGDRFMGLQHIIVGLWPVVVRFEG